MESKYSQLKDIHKELKDSWELQSIFSNEKKITTLKDWTKVESYKLLDGNKEDIQNIIEQNKDSILLNLLNDKLPQANKGKRWPLNKFLKEYLLWLSIEEEGNLLTKIDYYLELYELYWLGTNDKLDKEILADKDSFSKIKILFELLFSSSLLPDYKNQKQFNEEMMKFIPRLEKSINKILLKRSPIIIPPINARQILLHLNDRQWYRVLWSKSIKWGLIKQIGYDFYLWERQSINEANEFSFSFLINDESLLSRSEFIVYLKEILKLPNIQDNKEFLLDSDSFFNYSIYVWEEMFEEKFMEFDDFKQKWLDEDWFMYNGFEVKIYAQKKRNFQLVEEFSNMCRTLPGLTEKTIKDIYETYWRLNWEEEGFPEKPFVFNVADNLNVKYEWDNLIDVVDAWVPWSKLTTSDSAKEKYKFYKSEDIWYALEDLVLEKELLDEIEELLDFYEDIDFYIENNWDLPKWIILFWPPWTWKTTITLILAKHSWAWVFVAEANQEDSLVWESANNIKSIIDNAKKFIDETWKPAIIFFDEADTLFSKRWWDVKDFKEGMLSVLLQEMDWFDKKYEWKLTFVFGSNRKDMLDSALLSRADKHLEIPLPNKEAREKILDLHIRKKMKGLKSTINIYEKADIDLELLAKKLEWKSGRFIKNLVKNFHNKALRAFKKDSNFVITNDFILDSVKYTEDKTETIEKVMWFRTK